MVRPLLAAGVRPDELGAMTLGDVPASADRERLRDRRTELGIPSSDDDPLLVHVDGDERSSAATCRSTSAARGPSG